MTVIDCDAHVEESEATWSYLDPKFHLMRPIPVVFPEDTCFGSHNAAWVIDYKLRFFSASPTLMKRSQEKGASIAVQEMADIDERIECLDEMGIDKQVVFPSIWLGTLAENVELEAALARSNNQYMATQCAKSGGRLSYVAPITYRRPDLAVQEIRRVKEDGCCVGIFTRGVEWDLPLSNPAFWPIYEEAERQDLPICVHVGNGSSPTISRMLEGIPRPTAVSTVNPLGTGLVSGPYVLYAFHRFSDQACWRIFPGSAWGSSKPARSGPCAS
jgi:predicted TIM-barrel fold metal-dependent hydrolase